MNLPGGPKFIKYLLFVFNLLFVITGLILLGVGSVIAGVYSKYFHFLDDKFLSVPNLLIATGVIIFFIAFFGCCGALRESYCMILTFTSLLMVIFIFEIAGGISGYVLRNRVHDVLKQKMNESMIFYKESGSDFINVWDEMQINLDCCGVNNSSDWYQISKNDSLPFSCCENLQFRTCTLNVTHREPGCLVKLEELISSHALELGGVGLGIGFVQAAGIIFSIYLARAIKHSYQTV